MKTEKFTISQEQLSALTSKYFLPKSSNEIGKFAREIVELYFLSLDSKTKFPNREDRNYLSVLTNGITSVYIVKGTEIPDIAWERVKISGRRAYEELVGGMTIIRVTNIRLLTMTLYFLKYNEDFILTPEPRWSAEEIK